jgi:ketosteroid isomerase-like protein
MQQQMNKENKEIIEKFYTAFNAGDPKGMNAFYDDEIQFEDPAFGILKGQMAKNMWLMMVAPGVKVTFSNVEANERNGSADWEATYTFSQTGRKVVNRIHAEFEFRNGKIVNHKDVFSMWRWSKQALGLPGLLLGWSPIIKNKVNKTANEKLRKFSDGLSAKKA